ncbi:MAG: NADH-quinone oxidoreductase subunit N [Verrucomicrobiia bacterium]
MTPFNYLELLQLAVPETIVVVTALVVLAIDLLGLRDEPLQQRFNVCGTFACFGCVAAAVWTLTGHGTTSLLGGMLVSDPVTRVVKIALLAMAIFTVLISMTARFTDHVGEFLALILLATVGMMFMAASEELLTIFVALELTSLSLYILTAFHRESLKSAEAALKYFLFGAMSAAFTLFGLSLVYGLAGSTYLREIAGALRGQPINPLLIVAIVMTVIGLGFKVAAAPFHLWAPDAYQGAPTPSAAFIASGSKIASFVVFARVMMIGFDGVEGSGGWGRFASGWVPALGLVAGLSMVLGNLGALVQSSVKRLLAYSAIAHAGYALLGVAADTQHGVFSLAYYVITYGLTVLGAFGVVHVVEQTKGDATFADFAGLSRRAPILSFCMLIFMLSLAGIPPLAGFFGKFYLFAAAAGSGENLGLLWLVILAVGMSAVSLYYYLQVLKQIYVADAPPDTLPLHPPVMSQVVLGVLALAVIVLGCAPDLLLSRLTEVVKLASQ